MANGNGLTPATININPRGLLDFFALKNGGRNPQEVSSVVAPTWDLLEWYESSLRENFFGTIGSVTALGLATFAPALAPPATEVWLIWRLGVSFSCSAIQEFQGSIGVVMDGAGATFASLTPLVHYDGAALGATVGQPIFFPTVSPRTPLLLSPPHSIQLTASQLTAFPGAFNIHASLTKLRV